MTTAEKKMMWQVAFTAALFILSVVGIYLV